MKDEIQVLSDKLMKIEYESGLDIIVGTYGKEKMFGHPSVLKVFVKVEVVLK